MNAVEPLEQVGQLVLCDARAGVSNLELGVIAAPANRNADRTLERELERVR